MRKNNPLLFTMGLAVTAVGTIQACAQSGTQAPNVILILVDDLGLGDLSCQYATDLATPNIDELFTTGVRLDNFYANSNVSSPSRAALLTGRFPAMVGVPGVVRTTDTENWGYFDPTAVTLPEVLERNGYNTALVGKWHLGLESPNLPGQRGFSFFHGFLGDMMDDYYTHLRQGNNYMYRDTEQINPEGHATDLFTAWACDYLETQSSVKDPFFLYLAYNAPHTPLQPPAEWLAKVKSRAPEMSAKRQQLVALIEHLDYNIGLLIKKLNETGQRDNTLIIFASDNGGDRGAMANNGPTRGAKGDMFEGGIKVVCALNQPGVFEGGRRVDNFIVMMDLFPTLCQILGIQTTNQMDGISVLDAIKGKEQNTTGRYVYWLRYEGGARFAHGTKPQTAVRYGDYKLLRNLPEEEPLIFDLSNDPLERQSLPLSGDIYNDLNKAMEQHYRQSEKIPNQPPK